MGANAELRAALEGFNTTFNAILADFTTTPIPGKYTIYTETMEGGASQILTMGFIGNTPLMRKWLGSRVRKDPRAYTNSIEAVPYESTMPLARTMVQQDQAGVVGKAIRDQASAVIDFYDQVVSDSYLSNSGAGPTGFDGVALFSASHPYADSSGNTQSNIGSGTTLSHSNLIAAETAGALLTEENGRNYRISYNEIHVGPRLRRRAEELVGNDRVVIINQAGTADVGAVDTNMVNAAATRSNVLGGGYSVVVDSRVTNYYWTLRDTNRAKPMILWVTRAPEIINQIQMESDVRFNTDKFLFGVEADVGAGAYFWPGVYRGTGTE